MEVGDRLRELEDAAGIADPPAASDAGRLRHLIRTLHERANRRVVVLIDEYDKPILDALDAPEVARANRDYLRGLYAVVKDCDTHIRFSFITGVSKFSKVSLFSGLNNLLDITLDPRYSAICGYTEADVDAVFAPELPGLDRERIREWYNVFYSHFAALGLDVAVEESTSRGRLDMAVRFDDRVYIFEFKVVEQAGKGGAMAQLKDRGYADKYRAPDVDVHLIGVEFSSASRNVVTFEYAAA